MSRPVVSASVTDDRGVTIAVTITMPDGGRPPYWTDPLDVAQKVARETLSKIEEKAPF